MRRLTSEPRPARMPPQSLHHFDPDEWEALVGEEEAAPYVALGCTPAHARRQALFRAWSTARRAWRSGHGWPGGAAGEMQGSLREGHALFCPAAPSNPYDRRGVW